MDTLSPNVLQALLGNLGMESPIPLFSSADSQNNPLDIYLSYLANILVRITGCEPQVAYESILWSDELSDLTVVTPKLRLKDVKPKDLAVDLNKKFPPTPIFDRPFQDGINLRIIFSSTTLARVLLPYIIDRGQSYGKDVPHTIPEPDGNEKNRSKVVVEFSSPNIGKEFDGNHLRSTIIGASIASFHESMGWDVVRMNFLGDWGRHIGLLAVGWSRFGSEELFKQQPLRHLVDVYNKIDEIFKPEQEAAKKSRADGQDASANAIESQGVSAEKDEFFKKMEDGDPNALALWKRFRNICIANYSELYARLNISFDDYSGESEVRQETIAEVESILREKEIYETNDEAWIIDFKKHGHKGLGTAIARYRNGTTSYLLRDIAAVLERDQKYAFDKMIYVVSAKQDGHFQQLFKALELMGLDALASKLSHISFGKVQGATSGSGSQILLGDMLDQCQTVIKGYLEADLEATAEFQGGSPKVLESLSATSLMVQDLSVKRLGAFAFDVEKIAVTDGHNGLNLQQWYAKLSSKLKGTWVPREELESADYCVFEQEEYADVLRVLVQFPSIAKGSFKPLEASTILAFLFRLIDLLPGIWNDEEEEGSSSQPNLAELALFECVRHVLVSGMTMVGLMPVRLEDLE